MGLNPNAASMKRGTQLTEDEKFAAMVKLIGLVILGLVCSVVLVVSPP